MGDRDNCVYANLNSGGGVVALKVAAAAHEKIRANGLPAAAGRERGRELSLARALPFMQEDSKYNTDRDIKYANTSALK